MSIIDRIAVWWLRRTVQAARAELKDAERQRVFYESAEIILLDDVRLAEYKLAKRLQRSAAR